MSSSIRERYQQGFITDEQLDRYVKLGVVSTEDAAALRRPVSNVMQFPSNEPEETEPTAAAQEEETEPTAAAQEEETEPVDNAPTEEEPAPIKAKRVKRKSTE